VRFAADRRTTWRAALSRNSVELLRTTKIGDRLLFVTDSVLTPLLAGLRAYLPLLVLLGVLLALVSSPLPGRGPRMFQRHDPWRGFKFATRRAVMTRAGGRCEAPLLLGWGRCQNPATEVDHVYPCSREACRR
jgi:hypothetical protein